MKATEKIQKLNTLAETLRVSVRDIATLFKDNGSIEHIAWRINKQISDLHQEVCKTLEKEIRDEEFQRLISQFDEDDK